MRQCLTSPDGGYYTSVKEGKDQFGQKGDFITSPEISQIFGELLGIWLVAEWMAQGKISNGVEIIEVGPGRGTLMDDMLRVRYGALFKEHSASVLISGIDAQQLQIIDFKYRTCLPCRSQSIITGQAETASLRQCSIPKDRNRLSEYKQILKSWHYMVRRHSLLA